MTVAAGDPPAECDVAVVGGGILGTAVTRELARRRPGARICLLEAEAGLATHQTGRSSGVIHAGIPYPPGSLKARLCVEGSRELYAYCEAAGLACARSGKVMLATQESELPILEELHRRGTANGVSGLRRIGPDELAEIEPGAAGLAALHSPATGVTDFAAMAASFARDAASAGVSVHLGAAVRSVRSSSRALDLVHHRGTTRARLAIFCAGPWADRLARECGAPSEPRIVPFRGAYLRLRGAAAEAVRANVYPLPDPALPFLGVHLTRTLGGDLMVGPTALMVPARRAGAGFSETLRDIGETLGWPGTWRLAWTQRRAALVEMRLAMSRRAVGRAARRLVPALDLSRAEAAQPGIRAQALARDGTLVDDFVIHRSERAVHVRNAPSPAATSALPLARLIADEAESV